MPDAATLTVVFQDQTEGSGSGHAPTTRTAAPSVETSATPTVPPGHPPVMPPVGAPPPPPPAAATPAPFPLPTPMTAAIVKSSQSESENGPPSPPSWQVGSPNDSGASLARQAALVPINDKMKESGSPFGQPNVGGDSMVVGGLGAIYRLLTEWHSEWLSGIGQKKPDPEQQPKDPKKQGGMFEVSSVAKMSALVGGLAGSIAKMISIQSNFENQVMSIQAAAVVDRRVLMAQAKTLKAEAEKTGSLSRWIGGGMVALGAAASFVPGGAVVGAPLIAGGTAVAGSGSMAEVAGTAKATKQIANLEMQDSLMKRMHELAAYNPALAQQEAIAEQNRMHRDIRDANNPAMQRGFEVFSNLNMQKEKLEGELQAIKDEKTLKKQAKETEKEVNDLWKKIHDELKTMNEEERKRHAERMAQNKKQVNTPLEDFLEGIPMFGDKLQDKNDAIRKLRDAEVIKPLLGDL